MSCKLAICSLSLGRCAAGHSLEVKLDAAYRHGIRGIEVFYEDLVDYASGLPGGPTPENQLLAAHKIRHMCDSRHLKIICLQPLMHFEGLVDRAEHACRMATLALFLKIVRVLGTNLIVIPSNFLPAAEVSPDVGLAVADLTKAADLAAKEDPPVRIAYESLAWGTRIDVWEQAWALVELVDRPNFGLCLDTFNIAGRIYADPATRTCRTPNCDVALRESLKRLVQIVDPAKVFFVQLGDGACLNAPITPGHPLFNPEQPPRMVWSRNHRLFYGEEDLGGYLPIERISRAIFEGLRYRGWVSFEIFNRRLFDTDAAVPNEMARRAVRSWAKMVVDVDMGIRSGSIGGVVQAYAAL